MKPTLRELVYARDGGFCAQCGFYGDWQVDHIKERTHGGPDDLENLQTLCVRCHKRKTSVWLYGVPTKTRSFRLKPDVIAIIQLRAERDGTNQSRALVAIIREQFSKSGGAGNYTPKMREKSEK